MEGPEFSGWKLVGVLFLGAGIIVLLPVVLVLRCLSKSPGTMLNQFLNWHHLSMIFRGPQDRGVPTRYLRVRNEGDAEEVIVRAKGHYQGGSVMLDDRISAEGSWRDGVLTARQVYNHRTQSWTRFSSPTTWH